MLEDLIEFDPVLQTIEEKYKLGLWPPSPDCIANSIYPYILRLKKEKVKVLDVGTFLGETAYRLLELDTKKKIEKLVCVPTHNDNPIIRPRLEKNLQGLECSIVESIPKDEKFDVILINCEVVSNVRGPDFELDNTMKTYYNHLDHNGIFAGNDHHKTYVKESLANFRRPEKIGTPIQISNKLIWFWYKR